MAGYVEAEVTRARVQASTPWTIETPEDATSFGEQQTDGSVEMTVEPGVAKRLNPGETMNAPGTNSPNPQVEAFCRYLLRDFASGSGVNYAAVSGDYSQSNYSSSRLALLDDRDGWRAFQAWFICTFREPIHREWMQQAVMSGAFKTFSVESWALDRRKFESVRFRPRGWGWVDPTKEVEAFKEAVRCGFMSQQDVLSQSGTDVEELIEQRAKEVKLAEEAGLKFDIDPAQDPKAQEAAKPAPDKEPEVDDEPTEPARVLSLAR
jgi:lambda family phage portal protein